MATKHKIFGKFPEDLESAFPRPMGVEERGHVIDAIIQKYIHKIMFAKGRDYTEYVRSEEANAPVTSANANFEEVARMLAARGGIDRYVTWSVYWIKHIQAILSWICTRQMKSEPLELRIADAINYLFILWTMLVEDGIITDPRVEAE